MSEIDIQRDIKHILTLHPDIVLWRNSVGGNGRYTYGLGKGSADLIGMCNGRFLAIEVKDTGKRPTVAQKKFLQDVNDAGGIGFWADSLEMATDKMKVYL